MVVLWHKLGEVKNECTSHNFSRFAISLLKIIKIGRNLTKFWQIQISLVFLRHGVYQFEVIWQTHLALFLSGKSYTQFVKLGQHQSPAVELDVCVPRGVSPWSSAVRSLLQSSSQRFHAQAIRHIRHLLSTDLAHTHWPAVWYWRDWSTATRYCTARQSVASRSCSVCKTTQSESSSRHRGGPMPNRWCVNYTGCWFNTEFTTRCPCWYTRLRTRLYHGTSPAHQPPRQRTDTTLDGYATAHPTVRPHRLRETFFSMRCAVSLELTSWVCHRKRLTVFKSRLKHSYFVGLLTSTHNRLPPAPLKLRPHNVLQICLLLLLLLFYKIKPYTKQNCRETGSQRNTETSCSDNMGDYKSGFFSSQSMQCFRCRGLNS